MRYLYLSALLSLFCLSAFAQVQSPELYFNKTKGEKFTPHHRLVDYVNHAADKSPLVQVMQYGWTNEDRPLLLAFISTEENLARLEDIRQQNLSLAGLGEESNTQENTAIVWLSFSVHGNEAAGSESVPYVLYDLIDPDNTESKTWLENTVVIMDPSVNPDGYSRYTNWQRQMAGKFANSNFDDIEHQEPWPGGRTNHYYFDLNRDWAWQTQIESQQRMKVYNQWLPHVHADLHEMGHNSSYYFAPAARPYHEYITDWQVDFQNTIGRNHARYFDEEGWLYFTKEVFDLFYPSYGDTYPIFSGAIGMTYEQGGSGRGGRVVKTTNGEELSLADRINHHQTTALSTVEISSKNADRLVDEFRKFYNTGPIGKYKSYVIKQSNNEAAAKALCELLDKQGIEYGTVANDRSSNGFSYQTGKNNSFTIESGDIVVSANQAKSVLAQVLLDPESILEDSLTYDITAWSLPYAYGLDAYALSNDVRPSTNLEFSTKKSKSILTKAYAYAIPASGLSSYALTGKLVQAGITSRMNEENVTFAGQGFPPGTIFITRADNRSMEDRLVDKINEIVMTESVEVVPISSGFADSGKDLGSNEMRLVTEQNILTIMGDGVSSYTYGQVRHFFDHVINHPITVIEKDQLGGIDLSKYTTLILPDGYYRLSSSEKEKVATWVSGGGKVIAIGGATRHFVDDDNFSLQSDVDGEKSKEDAVNKQADLAARYNHYSDRERKSISNYVPGAVVKLKMDPTHPLAFGMGSEYFSLRTSSTRFPHQTDVSNVGIIEDDPMVVGFMGASIKNKLQNTMVFGVEEKGRGQIIYLVDNPLFRGFWYNGLKLFCNALFLVN